MFSGSGQEQVERPQFFPRRLDMGRQRQIQRLGSSGGEDDMMGRDIGESRHLGAGGFDHGPRRPPFAMDGGGIAAKVKRRAHGRAGRRMQGRRGVMVEVDGSPRHERARNLVNKAAGRPACRRPLATP